MLAKPSSAALPPHHLYVLDGLRALAVGTVMLRHYGASHCFGGILGVDLFFVLSGFLITRLLVAEFEASGAIRFDLFYQRRVCRLMPAIVALLLFVTLMRAFVPSTSNWPLSWWFSDLAVLFSFANYFSHALQALGHTWSLSVEEQFYFFWPMSLLVILRRCRTTLGRVLVPLMLALTGAVLRAWLYSGGGHGISVYHFLFTRMDSLLVGAALALAEALPGFPGICARLCRFRPAELAMATFGVLIFVVHPSTLGLLYYGGMTLVAVVFAVLIASCIYEPRQTALKQFLQWHPVVWLGRRSYGIYLYHLPIFYLLQPFRENYTDASGQVAYLSLAFGLPVILAALSYRYIEVPFLELKVHLKWNFPGQAWDALGGEKAPA